MQNKDFELFQETEENYSKLEASEVIGFVKQGLKEMQEIVKGKARESAKGK